MEHAPNYYLDKLFTCLCQRMLMLHIFAAVYILVFTNKQGLMTSGVTVHVIDKIFALQGVLYIVGITDVFN